MLMILALICFIQGITAWIMTQLSFTFMIMMILFMLVILGIGMTRRAPSIESTASVVLTFLVIMGALLEVLGGRSPNTPLIYWSPVILFGAYVFCGLRRGTGVAAVIMLSTLAIIVLPFALNDARILPGAGVPAAFHKRLFVAVLLCHLLPLGILAMYEKFFALCHAEAQALFDKMEVRKDRASLGRLAQVLVGEMEPQLGRMEKAYSDLQRHDDILNATQDVMKPLHKLVELTRRYEPLSMGALNAADEGLMLQDFPDILKRFTEIAEIRLEGVEEQTFRLQGGQSFLVMIFLCLALRKLKEQLGAQVREVILKPLDKSLVVVVHMERDGAEPHLSLAQEFLNDMDAKIRVQPKEQGTTMSLIEIEVPLHRT